MKKIKLAFYRTRLKSAYLRYRSIHDEYDCGAALTEHISNRAVEAKARVNRWITKINALAPNTLKPL